MTSKIIVTLEIAMSLLQTTRFYLHFHAHSFVVSYGDCIISHVDARKPISLACSVPKVACAFTTVVRAINIRARDIRSLEI